MIRNLQLNQRLLHRGQHAEVSATWAPVWIDLALKVCHGGQFWSRYICRHRLFLLDHNLVRGNGKRGAPAQLFFDCFHNVVGHKGFAIVLTDVSVGHKTGFAAQVAGELATEIDFDDDGVSRLLKRHVVDQMWSVLAITAYRLIRLAIVLFS